MSKHTCLILVFLLIPLFCLGSLVDDLNRRIQEKESRRLELEKQAQEYQNIIDQKRKEINNLSNQIAIFNAEINKLLVSINITEDKIEQTELEIEELNLNLEKNQNNINYQKNNLAVTIQLIAENDNLNNLEIILTSESFSDFFGQIAYIENLQAGLRDKIDQLKILKSDLTNNKEAKEIKKQSLEKLKQTLSQQKVTLAGQRTAKESLVKYTKGEEKKYQNLLANVETQKQTLLGDINRLMQERAAELARLKQTLETPPNEYWASNSWYYAQNDPAWTNAPIGLTNSTLGDYGCAIASVAMVFQYHGAAITPLELSRQPIFYYNLIIWPNQWGSVQLFYKTYRILVDWSRIDQELTAGHPVIVRIQADGKSGGHYVAIHHKTKDSRYVVHDPLFGANIYLDSSRAYIGALYQTTTSINQMIIYH